MFLFSNDLLFLLPELYWTCIVIVCLLRSTFATAQEKKILVNSWGWFMIFMLTLLMLVYTQLPVVEYLILNFQYGLDAFSYYFRLAILFFLCVAVYLSLSYFFFERIFFTEYFFFLGLFCLSAFFLVSANEFTFFYLAIELQALILYTVASLKRYNVFSAESGLKYFVLGALSSGLLLFGISFFYGFVGVINFYEVRFLILALFDNAIYAGVGLAVVFILSAFLFKLAGAPFHIWLPDVYDGAPTPVVAFFATLPKLAVVFFLVKLYLMVLVECAEIWHTSLLISGFLSVIWGTFAALNQFSIKRLYAYSAVVNVGYLLLAMSYGTVESFSTVVNYLIPYIFSTVAIFLVVLIFRKVDTLRKIKFIGDYKHYFTYNTTAATLIVLIFFSLAGVPPLAGFFTKFFLFRAIFLEDFLTNFIIFAVILTSVVSAFYYIRVVRFAFFYNARNPLLFVKLNFEGVLLLVIAVIVLVNFLWAQPLVLAHATNLISSLSL